MSFGIVVAVDKKRGIGRNGRLPWKLRGDMKWFKELTTSPETNAVLTRYRMDQALKDKRIFAWETLVARIGGSPDVPKSSESESNAVLMGRKTWDSLPLRFRPLADRANAVISRQLIPGLVTGSHEVWPSFSLALEELSRDKTIKNIFVVGGGEIYAEALKHPECKKIFITEINSEFSCDTFLPELDSNFQETASSPCIEENGVRYQFRILERD